MTSSAVAPIQDNTVTFKCNIKDESSKVCGTERKIAHCKDKAVSIQHIEKTSKRCASHASVDVLLKNASPNYVTVNGERHKMYTFTESFTHHVDLLWTHGRGSLGICHNATRISNSMSAGMILVQSFLVIRCNTDYLRWSWSYSSLSTSSISRRWTKNLRMHGFADGHMDNH
jgi:hypothetical protein